MISGRRFYYGWLIVAACFMTGGLVIGTTQYAFGAFVEPLGKEFNWTRTQINAALSFGALANLASPFLGRVIDRHGARPVMLFSLVLLAVSFLLRPFMTALWQWYALTGVQSVSLTGALFLPAGKLIGTWFEKKRGRVYAITSMGNNAGGFLFASMAGYIVGYASWRWAFFAFGILSVLVTIFVYFVVRDDPKTKPGWENYIGRQEPDRKEAASHASADIGLRSYTVEEALKTRAFYAVALGLVATNFAFSTALTQLVPHLENEGYTLERASLMLSLIAIFALFGKMLFGYMADKIATRHSVIISLVGQTLAMMIIIIAPRSFLIWLFIPAYGVSYGGLGPLTTLLVQETFGLRFFGSIQGIFNVVTVVSSVGGPLMAGILFDATQSYRPTYLAISIIFVIGSLVLTQAKHSKQRMGAVAGT